MTDEEPISKERDEVAKLAEFLNDKACLSGVEEFEPASTVVSDASFIPV